MCKKEDGLIDWSNKSRYIINQIRALVKWPVCYSFLEKNRINIYQARINNDLDFDDYKNDCNGKIVVANKNDGIVVKASDGLINLERLQQKGKKPI